MHFLKYIFITLKIMNFIIIIYLLIILSMLSLLEHIIRFKEAN